nr:2,3-bisphosphoglycerate-independent phosphoglycerate mutase [Paracoccaceae bacterium]
MTMPPKPIVLCILDGWGLREETEANAVALAATPVYDRLSAGTPMTRLSASGEDVGLNTGQMGNSEVGHTNIGAGRVVWMDLPKINNAIYSGEFAQNPRLTDFIAANQTNGGVVHIMGLMSPGGVHAHQNHIAEAVRVIAGTGAQVALHLFLDGRDTPPKSAKGYLTEFEAAIAPAHNVQIATVSGRFYALDRDNRWDRVERAWRAIVLGDGEHAPTAHAAIEAAYARGETDEFAAPCVLNGYSGAHPGDSLFMTHFRADRAREILSALLDPEFDDFARPIPPQWSTVLGMVEYSNAHNRLMTAMFPREEIIDTLGAWLSSIGRSQFRLAETEKY